MHVLVRLNFWSLLESCMLEMLLLLLLLLWPPTVLCLSPFVAAAVVADCAGVPQPLLLLLLLVAGECAPHVYADESAGYSEAWRLGGGRH